MPDAWTVTMKNVQGLKRELKSIDRDVDRATMWAVREAGRKAKQEAKRAAPVYTGRDAVSRKAHETTGAGGRNRPVKGLYKASIHSSRRLIKEGDGTYAVRVAPRGARVHLYTGAVEAKYHPMQRGYDAVVPQFNEIAERAYRRATRR